MTQKDESKLSDADIKAYQASTRGFELTNLVRIHEQNFIRSQIDPAFFMKMGTDYLSFFLAGIGRLRSREDYQLFDSEIQEYAKLMKGSMKSAIIRLTELGSELYNSRLDSGYLEGIVTRLGLDSKRDVIKNLKFINGLKCHNVLKNWEGYTKSKHPFHNHDVGGIVISMRENEPDSYYNFLIQGLFDSYYQDHPGFQKDDLAKLKRDVHVTRLGMLSDDIDNDGLRFVYNTYAMRRGKNPEALCDCPSNSRKNACHHEKDVDRMIQQAVAPYHVFVIHNKDRHAHLIN